MGNGAPRVRHGISRAGRTRCISCWRCACRSGRLDEMSPRLVVMRCSPPACDSAVAVVPTVETSRQVVLVNKKVTNDLTRNNNGRSNRFTLCYTPPGDGAGNITGYTVTEVSYDLNATDPAIIDGVAFTLNSAPETGSEIQVRLNSSSTDWYACTNVSAAVTCDTSGSPEITVVDADEPRVVAVD